MLLDTNQYLPGNIHQPISKLVVQREVRTKDLAEGRASLADGLPWKTHDQVTPFASQELPLVRAMSGEALDDVEMFIRHEELPEGVYISVNGRPLENETGEFRGGLITFRDMTERKASDEALRSERDFNQTLVQTSPAFFFAINEDN